MTIDNRMYFFWQFVWEYYNWEMLFLLHCYYDLEYVIISIMVQYPISTVSPSLTSLPRLQWRISHVYPTWRLSSNYPTIKWNHCCKHTNVNQGLLEDFIPKYASKLWFAGCIVALRCSKFQTMYGESCTWCCTLHCHFLDVTKNIKWYALHPQI